MSKYNNKKITEDNIVFDSLAEHRRYCELKLLQDANEIAVLEVHPRWLLEVNGVKVGTYIADFAYVDRLWTTKRYVVEDVKSEVTRKLPVFRLKKKLMLALHGIDIQEVEA